MAKSQYREPRSPHAAKEVFDMREAAGYLGIAVDTLYQYASEGMMPAFKLGNRWKFKRSLLNAWIVKKSKENMRVGGAA